MRKSCHNVNQFINPLVDSDQYIVDYTPGDYHKCDYVENLLHLYVINKDRDLSFLNDQS